MVYLKFVVFLSLSLFHLGIMLGMLFEDGLSTVKFIFQLTTMNCFIYSAYLLFLALDALEESGHEQPFGIKEPGKKARNNIFKWAFIVSYTTTVCFWAIFPLGEDWLKQKSGVVFVLFEIYLHLGIAVLCSIDMATDLRQHTFSTGEITVYAVIYSVLFSFDIVLGKAFSAPVYPFIEHLSYYQNFLMVLITMVVGINACFFYNWISNKYSERKDNADKLNSEEGYDST